MVYTCVEVTESCVYLSVQNMTQYFLPNGTTWHLFSKIVFLSHLCALSEELRCLSLLFWSDLNHLPANFNEGSLFHRCRYFSGCLPLLLIFILVTFNRSCETACLQGKSRSSAETKLHVRTKVGLASFFVDKKETRVNWGERLWATVDMQEGKTVQSIRYV